jgi:mono/diheme cytochrome c family protein
MQYLRYIAIGTLSLSGALASDGASGDLLKGASFFGSQGCLGCHRFKGIGATQRASDLGNRRGRDYTPALMASLLWNHGPAMWPAMRRRGIERPKLGEDRARDLFAFFYSARYFDKPGDAGRGKRLFAANGCAGCHGIAGDSGFGGTGAPGGSPVMAWRSLDDPIMLAQQMWNHPIGNATAETKSKSWRPKLTSQELTDMLVYLQNLPQARGRRVYETLKFSESGLAAPEAESCGHSQCHGSKPELDRRLRNRTLTDVAVAMWNHKQSTIRLHPALARSPVADYVTTVWAGQFFHEGGRAERGRRVFVAKRCAECHDGSASGAKLSVNRPWSAISMVAAVWEHGPRVNDAMKRRNLRWPRFNGAEMSDLITYLNSLAQPRLPVLLRAAIAHSEQE